MASILDWIKKNKLTTVLIFIVIYLLLKNNFPRFQYSTVTDNRKAYDYDLKMLPAAGGGAQMESESLLPVPQEPPPVPEVKNRLVIKQSYLSLLVTNVVKVQKEIISTTETLGGYMVNSTLNNPQEAATATVVVRIPSKNLNQALNQFRSFAVKIISENFEGEDVTDQYVDIEAKLATLYKTKAKFEEIMEKAREIQNILNVQREIINLQSQIDNLKGQQQYLKQNAKMAKLTIYLSTDELALPYTPSQSWRPKVIFKQAVRSLIGNLRKIGTLLIWLAVYSVVWIPVGIIVFIFLRKKHH